MTLTAGKAVNAPTTRIRTVSVRLYSLQVARGSRIFSRPLVACQQPLRSDDSPETFRRRPLSAAECWTIPTGHLQSHASSSAQIAFRLRMRNPGQNEIYISRQLLERSTFLLLGLQRTE